MWVLWKILQGDLASLAGANISIQAKCGLSIAIILDRTRGPVLRRRWRHVVPEPRVDIGRCTIGLFSERGRLDSGSFKGYAKVIGLDETTFAKCFDERQYLESIFQDRQEANRWGFHGTPGFILMPNGWWAH